MILSAVYTQEEVDMKSFCRQQASVMNRELLRELVYDPQIMQNEPKMDLEQLVIYQKFYDGITARVVLFLLLHLEEQVRLDLFVLARSRSQNKIALAVTSSGITENLITGPRTANSTLQIPLDLILNGSACL